MVRTWSRSYVDTWLHSLTGDSFMTECPGYAVTQTKKGDRPFLSVYPRNQGTVIVKLSPCNCEVVEVVEVGRSLGQVGRLWRSGRGYVRIHNHESESK